MMPEKKKITIEVLDAGALERVRVLATVYGEWAFHPSYRDAGWQVTHVPTGKNLEKLADHFAYREAMQVVAKLGKLPPITVGPAGELGDEETKYLIHAIVGEVLGG